MDPAEEQFRLRAKALMRRRFRSHRASLPASAVRARSAALTERLLAHEAMLAAQRVALFWPIERFKEVDLRAVDEALRARGAEVAYPAIDPETRVMTFHVAEADSLTMSTLGFMAPNHESPPTPALDVVVVPGLAFDPRGYRIGYGAGFYDQALPTVRPPAFAIGVAFDFQLAADIPNSGTDVPVDLVITDERLLTPVR